MANKKIEAAIEELLLSILGNDTEELVLEQAEKKIGIARKLAPEDQ